MKLLGRYTSIIRQIQEVVDVKPAKKELANGNERLLEELSNFYQQF